MWSAGDPVRPRPRVIYKLAWMGAAEKVEMGTKVGPRKGMQLFRADGELIGMIESARGNALHVHGYRGAIPKEAIARVREHRVYLKESWSPTPVRDNAPVGDAVIDIPRPRRRAKPVAPIVPLDPREEARLLARTELAPAREADRLVVPLAEERLRVARRETDLGEVQVRKTVVERPVEIPVELAYETVQVRERDIADRPARPGDGVFQEGVIHVPIRGEEAVVFKEAVVTGEATIARERVAEHHRISDTVRQERVLVERDELPRRPR